MNYLRIDQSSYLNRAERHITDGTGTWVTRIKDQFFFAWLTHGVIYEGGKFYLAKNQNTRSWKCKKPYLYPVSNEYNGDGLIASYYFDKPCIRRKLDRLGIPFTKTDSIDAYKSFHGRWPNRRWAKGRKRTYLGLTT